MSHSVRQEFDAELLELKKTILTMGGVVEAMISDSLAALTTRDSVLAEEVQQRDREVDHMEMEADDLAVRIIALRQPAAGDLRHIVAALKVTTDLERMGDLAVNIAERVVELNAEPQLKPYVSIHIMVEKVRRMIREALDSFVSGDPEKARRVLASDNEVDHLNMQMFRELLTYMLEDTRTITRAMRLMFISKYLERLADHATNVAEEVIFAIEGRDVRHGHME